MGLYSLLTQEGVIHKLTARCKREVLQSMAERASKLVDAPTGEIVATLLEREQLGSTGVGDGVAIPHAKIEGLNKITGVLALLDTPVSFDSAEDQPVDIVFMLLAPANATAAHLKALAKVSRLLRNRNMRDALRGADSAESIFAIAVSDQQNDAA
ncbi:MAG: PTS IIA-like nitrogen-regulatory protein PtsN [Hyphococcus sp.]|nr:MAG: PTS IIA-like nitrogen-regulatory protein PtsN [Marinicaulis sp.]